MTDLHDLRTAVEEAAERARQPRFHELEVRARTRRRRRHGIAAGTVLVLALVAAVAGLAAGPSPDVRRPGPATHRHESTHEPATGKPPASRSGLRRMSAQEVVATGQLYSYGSGGSGEVATVWQVCVHDSGYCRYAWRLADPHGRVEVGDAWTSDGAEGPVVVPAAGSYLLASWNRPPLALATDGTVSPLRPGPPQLIEDQIGVVRHGKAGLEAVDPRTGARWPLPLPPGSDAVDQAAVSASGTVWALPAFAGPGRVEVSRLRDGVWQSHEIHGPRSHLAVPGLLAVAGPRMTPTHVAVLSTYDGATSLPVGVLAVSIDAGRSWRDLTKAQLPFDAVDSMAADGMGSALFVADPSGRVWRTDSGGWDRFTRVPGIRAGGLTAGGGERVLAEVAGSPHPRLAWIDGAGNVQQFPAR